MAERPQLKMPRRLRWRLPLRLQVLSVVPNRRQIVRHLHLRAAVPMPNPAALDRKRQSPGVKNLVARRTRRLVARLTGGANRSMIAVPLPMTRVARLRVAKIMVPWIIVTGIVNIMPRALAKEIAARAEVMKEVVGPAVRRRRLVVVNALKTMGTVVVPQMRLQGAMSPGGKPGGLNAGRRRVGFMPRGTVLECIVGRGVAVTTARVLPIVVREGHRKAPGQCTADMTWVVGLSGLATARGTPVDRCSAAGRKIDITKDLVARSSEAAVTMGLR